VTGDYGIGGGVEVMSRGGYLSTVMRNGARMGDTRLIDTMTATLTDPFGVAASAFLPSKRLTPPPRRGLVRTAAYTMSGMRRSDAKRRRAGGLGDDVQTVAALRHLVLDPGALDRVQVWGRPRPSMVVTASFTAPTGVTQERTAAPSTCTVQAPHWAMRQPYFGR